MLEAAFWKKMIEKASRFCSSGLFAQLNSARMLSSHITLYYLFDKCKDAYRSFPEFFHSLHVFVFI